MMANDQSLSYYDRFKKFGLTTLETTFNVFMDFLKKDPSEWKDDAAFKSSQQSLSGITTVNDSLNEV